MSGYWVAAHITGIFTIHDCHENPLERGSRGAGFSISRGITTSASISEDNEHKVLFDKKEMDRTQANISYYVLDRILAICKKKSKVDFGIILNHEFEIPLSCGFGASASGALGSAYALNDLLELELTEQEINNIAHMAEIDEGGGLGDILALHTGGWEYRIKEGAPFTGVARNILKNGYKVATITFGEMSTKSIVKNENWKQKINGVGELFLNELINEPSIHNFGIASKQFSISSMLATSEVMEFMTKYESENILIGQIMLGNGVFILYKDVEDLPKHELLVKEDICHSTVKKL